jgi:hypothetical protein
MLMLQHGLNESMHDESISGTEAWYVVKQGNGQCAILPANDIELEKTVDEPSSSERWGPYNSQPEAIARRVGLIRAGKCKPV